MLVVPLKSNILFIVSAFSKPADDEVMAMAAAD